jgi:hypothetical protein
MLLKEEEDSMLDLETNSHMELKKESSLSFWLKIHIKMACQQPRIFSSPDMTMQHHLALLSLTDTMMASSADRVLKISLIRIKCIHSIVTSTIFSEEWILMLMDSLISLNSQASSKDSAKQLQEQLLHTRIPLLLEKQQPMEAQSGNLLC